MNDTRLKLMEAIARKRLVTAHYNGQVLTLAPHLLFERHGDLFISALNLNKSWRSDEEPRLGHFKLGGLASIELSEDEFAPLPGFEPAPPREELAFLALQWFRYPAGRVVVFDKGRSARAAAWSRRSVKWRRLDRPVSASVRLRCS